MPGDVACCNVMCGTLVGVSVFSIMCSELLIMLEMLKSGMLVTCHMQYAMSVSMVLYCGDAVSLGEKYVFAIVMCLVLPMCILTSCSSVVCVFMALGMFMFDKVMSSLMSAMRVPPPTPSLFVFPDVCMVT